MLTCAFISPSSTPSTFSETLALDNVSAIYRNLPDVKAETLYNHTLSPDTLFLSEHTFIHSDLVTGLHKLLVSSPHFLVEVTLHLDYLWKTLWTPKLEVWNYRT